MRITIFLLLYGFFVPISLACTPFAATDASFNKGSSSLDATAAEKLAKGLDRYRPFQSINEGVIIIVGHAGKDEKVSDSERDLLALRRAKSAQDFFIKQGVPYHLTYIESKGATQPVTKIGATDLRPDYRVEIEFRLVPKPDPCQEWGAKNRQLDNPSVIQ